MFWTILQEAEKDLASLKQVLGSSESLRSLLFSHLNENEGATAASLVKLQHMAPSKSAWLLYDHCAALTRIYAIFENFMERAVSEYLQLIPNVYPQYSDLPKCLTTQHRLGIATLLSKLGEKGLYSHLSEHSVIDGLARGQRGDKYTLLPDAFLADQKNYRPDKVNQVFASLDFANLWRGVESHRSLINYMETRDSNDSPRTILIELVQDRNAVSHSVVSQTLAPSQLISLTDFTLAVMTAITEMLRKRIAILELAKGFRIQLGSVVHKFSGNVVGIEFKADRLKCGQKLLLICRDGAREATIMSLRKHNETLQMADTQHFGGLGLKLDVKAEVGDRLISAAPYTTADNLISTQKETSLEG